jgi:hypothetical protein
MRHSPYVLHGQRLLIFDLTRVFCIVLCSAPAAAASRDVVRSAITEAWMPLPHVLR